jgi:hypothetical protein
MRSTVGLLGDVLERPRPGHRPERAEDGEDGVLLQAVVGTAPAVAATTSSHGVGASPKVAVVADASIT